MRDAENTNKDRVLTAGELDQVSGGYGVKGDEYLVLQFGLVGLALFLTQGTLKGGLQR